MSRHNQSTAAQIKRIVFQWAWLLALALLALRGPGDVAVDAKKSNSKTSKVRRARSSGGVAVGKDRTPPTNDLGRGGDTDNSDSEPRRLKKSKKIPTDDSRTPTESRKGRGKKKSKKQTAENEEENEEEEEMKRKAKRRGRKKRRSTRKSKSRKSEKRAKDDSLSEATKAVSQAVKKLRDTLIPAYQARRKPGVSPEIAQVRQQLPLPTEDSNINDILALGYAYFLSNQHSDAHRVFNDLHRALKGSAAALAPGVYLGLVQTLSSLSKIDEAISFANKLVQARPDFDEAYNIKFQLMSATNRNDEAAAFFSSALKDPKVDKLFLLMLRGKSYYKMQKYASAYADFSAVNASAPRSLRAEVYGWLGRTEREMGNNDMAAWYLKKSIALSPVQSDTMFELALSYMEVAEVEQSMKYLNATVELNPNMKNAWSYGGLFLQTMGECGKALHYFEKALDVDSTEHTALMLSALCHMTELNFKKMLDYFQKMMDLKDSVFQILWPNAFFRREVAYFWIAHFDTPFSKFSIDVALDPWVKLGLHTNDVKNRIDEITRGKKNRETRQLAIDIINKHSDQKSLEASKSGLEAMKLMAFAKPWIQLDCPGFLAHTRQHRQFGLAVLEMAQALRAHVKAIQRGERGIFVSNAGSAFTSSPLHQADVSEHLVDAASGDVGRGVGGRSGEGQQHLFSYRDFLEIAVKWRQLAEPFDIVFWLDLYTAIPDMDIVTLTTSLFSGLKKNARYYQYYNFTFETAKSYMKKKYFLFDDGPPQERTVSRQEARAIEEATTLQQLFEISGASRAFYIVTDTYSLAKPGTALPGTKIIISKVPPEGYDISIGAPSNEKRFILFSAEVKRAFERIVAALVNGADSDYIVDLTLEFYFYWANWGPLSRGTAATGYATILAVLLANGEVVTSRMPRMKQMDWEAILRSDPLAFRDAVRPWLSGREPAGARVPSEWLDGAPGHRLSEIFRTPRDVMTSLASR